MDNAKIIVIKVGNNNLMDLQIIATPFSISFMVTVLTQKLKVLILHLHIFTLTQKYPYLKDVRILEISTYLKKMEFVSSYL